GESFHRLLWLWSVEALLDQLGITENRRQWSSELMAHVGNELRLVLAGDLDLAALLLNFVEHPRVLNRQHGLCSKSLQQLYRLLGKFARPPTTHHQSTNDPVYAE